MRQEVFRMARKRKLTIQWVGLHEYKYARGIHHCTESGYIDSVERLSIQEQAEHDGFDQVYIHNSRVVTLALWLQERGSNLCQSS